MRVHQYSFEIIHSPISLSTLAQCSRAKKFDMDVRSSVVFADMVRQWASNFKSMTGLDLTIRNINVSAPTPEPEHVISFCDSNNKLWVIHCVYKEARSVGGLAHGS